MKRSVVVLLSAFLLSSLTHNAIAIVVTDDSGTTSQPGFVSSDVWNSTSGSGVYIGNGWFLSASHVTGGVPGATRLPTLWVASDGGDDSTIIDSDLSVYFDATRDRGPATYNVGCAAPTVGADLLFIAAGTERVAGPATDVINWDSGWQQIAVGVPANSGYLHSNTRSKRWGTNEVSGLSYFTLNSNASPPPNFTRGLVTVFDNLPNEPEAQVEGGDSGGAVFMNGPNGWELTGIISGKATFMNQPSDATAFGNQSVMSDISFYRSAIEGIVGFNLCAVPEPSPLVLLSVLAAMLGLSRYAKIPAE